MKRIVLFLIIALSVSFVSNAMECEYAISPQFMMANEFSKNIATVSLDGKIAVTDRFGKIMVLSDKEIRLRGNGLVMAVGENDLAAFFDSKGNRLTEYLYDTYPVTDPKWGGKTYRFGYYDGDSKSDLVPFSRGKKYGFINSQGVEVIPPKYEYAYGFVNGMALVCSEGILSEYGTYTNGKYGYITENGEEILPPDSFWVAENDSNYNYILFYNGSADKTLADIDGNVVKADENGYAEINADYIKLASPDGRTGIAEKSGNIIVPLDNYDSIEHFGKDLFIIDAKKIVNNKSEVIYTAADDINIYNLFINIYDKSRFARITRSINSWEKLYGIIDSKGTIIIPPEYNTLYDLDEGLIYGSKSGKNFLFDYTGKLLCEINANNCGECVNGMFPAFDINEGKYGFLLNPLRHPKVYVNNKKIMSEVYPKIENNRTLIPMRAVFEALDANVTWDDKTRTVGAIRNNIEISLKIGENILYKNGTPIEIDVPAKIENNRTLVPLRAVSEALDCDVLWDAENREINITK